MKAVLYIGHGTRVKEGVRQYEAFIEKVKAAIDVPIQQHCFIELAEPSIQAGIDTCVERGATEIAIVPVLLLAAGHAKLDIPEEIDEAKEKHPSVTFRYGRVIGIDQRMVNMVVDRLYEAGFPQQQLTDIEKREDIAILLVGRGSSDPDANSDLAKLARLIWEAVPVDVVETCYLAATKPSFDDGLDRVKRMSNKKVYVLPYLLFTGLLMKQMAVKIEKLQEDLGDRSIHLCDYLGYHPTLIDIIADRVEELLEDNVRVNCDACKYRFAAIASK
ncbi:sirohydrochlorin chelatase [Bacillus alkalicellulosilyticus]|uniref:sirohydrochlorin chelatase n=1 Tax=Alkalihalobacterium alkalicellulosilyticum TaxID=1912214 RepID=UPI000996CBC3|nr:sirohydrochlorin chelatase [Bacillus alkalicellulosilyticus]